MKSLAFSLLALLLIGFGCASDTDSADTSADVASDDPPQWVTYEGKDGPGEGKQIVLVSGDEEYRSEEVLPELAQILAERHGFTTTVLFAQDPEAPGLINPNYIENIPGLEMLDDADLMVLFTRFRALPAEQMAHIEDYLMEGNPLVAIRTATHAFNYADYPDHPYAHWGNYHEDEGSPWHNGFGRLVLGEKWHTHHGHHKHQSARGVIAPGAENHPVTNGIADGAIWGPSDVYGVRLPMPEGTEPIFLGQVIDRAGEYDENDIHFGMRDTDMQLASTNPATDGSYNPNDPLMPLAWTKPYQLPGGAEGVSFTSTIGASNDFLNEGVRRLLVNAVYYMLDMDVPEMADVAVVGEYNPTAFNFVTDDYWIEKDLRVADYVGALDND
ncbi:MAG: hypothetical protein AAGJ10_16920 [Bacteroidota bacterium]